MPEDELPPPREEDFPIPTPAVVGFPEQAPTAPGVAVPRRSGNVSFVGEPPEPSAGGSGLLMYTDDQGRAHAVSRIEDVPERFRGQVKAY